MTKREHLANVAKDTINIVNAGQYINEKKKIISIKEDVEYTTNNTLLYTPSRGNLLIRDLNPPLDFYKTEFEVTDETTLKAAKRLIEEGCKNVVALNFASARNPGGGFLKGSSAQEESIARSSALYRSISQMETMYKHNARLGGLYSDYIIWSPEVSIFKDDMGNVLDEPYKCSFITSPAVNTTNLKKEEKPRVRNTMKSRIEKILAIAIEKGHEAVVLGAFGCGVFGNKPLEVAQVFKQVLNDSLYKGQFKKVTFAIYDKSSNKEIYNVFKSTFCK